MDEPRQRWRLVVHRGADAPPLPQRDLLEAWETGLRASGLPIATSGGRLRLAFGAPLAVGMPAERELVDLIVTQRLPRATVRDLLAEALPSGHTLVDLFDVWLGAPALQGLVRTAVYRAELSSPVGASLGAELPGAVRLAEACAGLIAAGELPRSRVKGGGTVRYDLRPLLDLVRVRESGPPPILEIRTRFDPERGTGRPDEVLDALWQEMELPTAAVPGVALTRERLILDGEV